MEERRTVSDKISGILIGILLVFLWHFIFQFFPLLLNARFEQFDFLDGYAKFILLTGIGIFQLFYVVPLLLIDLYARHYYVAFGSFIGAIITFMVSDYLYNIYLRYFLIDGNLPGVLFNSI